MGRTDCVDLRERFGERSKVEHEASRPGERWPDKDPWRFVLLCVNGHIFPWGGPMLGASTKTRGSVAKRLRRLDGVEVVMDGDDGVNVAFHIRDFEQVAEVMKPRRRRRLSYEHKAMLEAAAEPHRFKRRRGSESPQSERRRTQRAKANPEAAWAGEGLQRGAMPKLGQPRIGERSLDRL